MSIIASVPYGTNSYTDLTPPAGDSLYFVEIVHGPCNPHNVAEGEDDRQLLTTYTGTRSNIANRGSLIGIDEIKNTFSFLIYPDPAAGYLQIRYTGAAKAQAQIINTLGQDKFTAELHEKETMLNITSLAAGVYFIEVTSNGKPSRLKFVKE